MEIKFFTDDKVLDLSGQKISVQENNPKMSDKMFTKYFFPIGIYMDDEFVNNFGDYESDDAHNLEDTFIGPLLFENRVHQSKLMFDNTQGKMIEGQISYGLEEIPNFDKKLSELPLHKFSVPDIHTYAKEITAKKYPETDFNYPRMYTSKYPPDQEVWDAYDGYYNDLKPDGSEMRRNYIDEFGSIFNVNIIHPTPHLLYVLKTGFADAGLNLAGDILTDPIFAQRWMFSGTEYFTSKQQRRYDFIFSSANFDELFLVNGPADYCEYQKYVSIAKPGRYKIAGEVFFWRAGKMRAEYILKLNGNIIWSKIEPRMNSTAGYTVPVNFEFDVTAENSEVELYIYTQYHEDSWTVEKLSNLRITSNVLDDLQNTTLGEDTGVVTNLNEVDLTRAVPNMTFGDLVNIIRNRFNYGVDVDGNMVYMNRLGDKEPTDVQDFRNFEVAPAFRKKTLLNKRSFLLRSTELDDAPQPSMYFDKDGAFLNKKEKPETIIIESNCIILQTGIPKPGGYNTAIIKKDTEDALQLVWYDGLTDMQNNAKNPAGAEYPELFYSHWEKWLRQRIRGYEYQWKFQIPAEEFTYRITDQIFAYNNIHNIKTWTKDLVEGTYEVDIVTETI